jgi:hypothetical protein
VYFILDDKDTRFCAHYAILQMRLPKLIEEKDEGKEKKKKKKKHIGGAKAVIDLTQENIPPYALEQLLIFVYSGTVTERDPEKLIDLTRIALLYNVPRLVQLCEQLFEKQLTISNIFSLLKKSSELNVAETKTLCIQFALEHPDEFFTTANEDLGFKLYQEVTSILLKYRNGEEKKPSKEPRKITVEDTIVRDFQRLYESADVTGDVTFMIQNKEIWAHRGLLSAQSEDFQEIMQKKEIDAKGQEKNIKMNDKYSRISSDSFQTMLKFLYYGEKNLSIVHATELLTFSKDLKLPALHTACESVISPKAIHPSEVLELLDIAFSRLMEDTPQIAETVKTNGIAVVLQNIDKIDFSHLGKLNPMIGQYLLQEIQKKVLGNEWKIKPSLTSREDAKRWTPITLGERGKKVSLDTSIVSEKKPTGMVKSKSARHHPPHSRKKTDKQGKEKKSSKTENH